MLLLIVYILNRLVYDRLAHREGRISALPCEVLISRRKRLYPSATISFHLLHQMAHALIPRQQTHKMNMVANTTNADDLASGQVDQLTDIGVNTWQVFVVNHRAGGFDVEHDVEVNFTKRLCHLVVMLLPFQGVVNSLQDTQGDALGYVVFGLSGRYPRAIP